MVTELEGEHLLRLIHLRKNGHSIEVDARLSDAIALALRTRRRISRRGSGHPECGAVNQNSRESSMDVTRLQKWLEGVSEDELGKYKM